MAETTPKFGGLVVASLAAVVGVKYLLGGALGSAGVDVVSSVMVVDNIAATFTVGIVLGVVAGALASGFVLARAISLVTFISVVAVSYSALRAGDLVIIAETVGIGLSILYLLVRSPIQRVEKAHIDDSDSASRHGSTLR